MSIIRERTPGEPLREVMNISEEMGEGCLLISDGVPDFVLTPPEFGNGEVVPGVNGKDRCDVKGIYAVPEWAPPCIPCGASDNYVRMWVVLHLGTEKEFLLFECRCGNIGWGLRPLQVTEEDEKLVRFLDDKDLEPIRIAGHRLDRNEILVLILEWSKEYARIADLPEECIQELHDSGWRIVDAVTGTEDE